MLSARILIVEDNPSDVYILRRALLDQGEEFDLEIASDGEQAIQFIHSERKKPQDTHPCVVLLDLHLPKLDGLEVLRAFREEPILRHIQVVVMTGGASPQEEAELRRSGADYRPKPTGLSEFDALAADLIAICKESAAVA